MNMKQTALCGLVVLTMQAACAALYPFADAFESESAEWNFEGTWGRTATASHTPGYSLADTPGASYTNNMDASATLTSLDLSTAVKPALSFYHRFFLEQDWDFATVEVSVNGGGVWTEVASYTGNQPEWTREQLDLSGYAGQSDVRIRFRLVTDDSIVSDGWYLDDVTIREALEAPVLAAITGIQAHIVPLSWAVPAGCSEVRVLRTSQATFTADDWRDMHTVITLAPTVTNYTDYSVSPKTTYYYWLMALTSDGVHSLSQQQAATTPSGMTFPFLDDGEGGTRTWVAAGTWTLCETNAAYSGGHVWSDSPAGNYGDAINIPLTLSAPMNLSATVAPVVSFMHQYTFLSGDVGLVEVSLNNGTDWTELGRFTNGSQLSWRRERFALPAAATNTTTVLVRFRITTDAVNTADGWWLDDIAVSESPAVIQAPLLTEVQSHSMKLLWSNGATPDFSHYAIHRATGANVSFQSNPVGVVENPDLLERTDTGLAIDTVYYYRVFAVNRFGAYGPDGTESYARTLNHPLPFSDDFEGTLEAWNLTGEWGSQEVYAYAGTRALSATTNATYKHNSDTSAQTAVNLTGSQWPVLRFRDRFELGAADYLLLEVSPNGTDWTRLYVRYEGSRTEWAEQQVDLSAWKAQTNLRIRFRLVADNDSSTTASGWSIDALSVAEHAPLALALPFREGFDQGASNWLAVAWQPDTNMAYEGSAAMRSASDLAYRVHGEYWGPATYHHLTLAGPLDFTGVANPQACFRVKARLGEGVSFFRLEASTDNGVSWEDRPEANLNQETDSGWLRVQCDLTTYANRPNVRLRFMAGGYRYTPIVNARIDKLTVAERTPNVSLNTPVPGLKTVNLSWNASALGAAFRRYELRRSTATPVTLEGALVFSSTNVSETAFQDSGLSIGQTYYYRLFVVDADEMYSSGTERAATTVPLTLPVVDGMESLANWDVSGGSWGPDADACEGSFSLGDSPGAAYEHNRDTWMLTAVNMTGSQWPVLRFRDRFELGAADYLLLEVSPNGTDWTRLYVRYEGSRLEWAEQQVDLSAWKAQTNLRIRFRLVADNNAATTGDGWNIDALSLAEHAPLALALPFREGFEQGASNWLAAAWQPDTNMAYEGSAAMRSASDLAYRVHGEYWGPATYHHLTLAGPLDFTGVANPQACFRVKARLGEGVSFFRLEASTDNGVSWEDRPEANLNQETDSGWLRVQCDLTTYANRPNVRLRFMAGGYRYTPIVNARIDKLTVAERTPNVILKPLVPSTTAMELSWEPHALGSAFKRYEIYRHTAAGVTIAHTKIAEFTDGSVTNFTDRGLMPGTTYYYRLFVVNTDDMYSGGSERGVSTTPLNVGYSDPLENLNNWGVTGAWAIDSNRFLSGGSSLGDSPNTFYLPSVDTEARIAVNLQGSDWPVLKFHDRYDLAAGDWACVEVSTDGSGWTRMYGVFNGTRNEWREQVIDLSEWKNQTNLRIRFRVVTDSNPATTAYGWNIDNISITNHTSVALSYPFFENCEQGADRWLKSDWGISTNEGVSGSQCIRDVGTTLHPDGGYYGEGITYQRLVLGGTLDLRGVNDTQFSCMIKGSLGNSLAYFRVMMSTDAGLTWSELPEANRNNGWTASAWELVKCNMDAFTGKVVRVRFQLHGYRYQPEMNLLVDNIGIGGPAPSAPALVAPVQNGNVAVFQPQLVVTNAFDPQNDTLTYQFEVYSNETLQAEALVATVPVLASGIDTTAWTVDTPLVNHQRYWWRCRASDGTASGPWMATASFYVNRINLVPWPVTLLGPEPHARLADLSSWMTWLSTFDPNLDDAITSYQVQISTNASFTSLLADVSNLAPEASGAPYVLQSAISIQLQELAGLPALPNNARCYWRVRAWDRFGGAGEWAASDFIFGSMPVQAFTADPAGFKLQWEPSYAEEVFYVDFKPDLSPTSEWVTIRGPLCGTNSVIIAPIEGHAQGFFRLRTP